MQLERMNPWWQMKKVPTDWLGIKRFVLDDLIPYIPKRMALLLHGVRRVGKSTILFQLIQHLIDEKVNPYHILYFTFDEFLLNLEELLLIFERDVVKEPLRNKPLYIFLDEIQKHPKWWDKIKLFYDLYPNIKWFLSGSNGLMLHKKMTESLAGRVFSMQIQPLSFPEYLSFHQIPWDKTHLETQMIALEPYVMHYLETSGFPELYQEKDSHVIHHYFLETIENRIIFQDIPLLFKIEEPLLLQQLFKIVSGNPGMSVIYSHLANDFKRDWRTIESYLGYLEKSYLLNQLAVYSANMLTSRKKLKKFYPAYSAYSFLQNPAAKEDKNCLGHLVESVVVQVTNADYFIQTPKQEEVDVMIRKNNAFYPVEVKYRNKITGRMIQKMFNLMKKMDSHVGYMITQSEKRVVQDEEETIQLIPLVEFLLMGL